MNQKNNCSLLEILVLCSTFQTNGRKNVELKIGFLFSRTLLTTRVFSYSGKNISTQNTNLFTLGLFFSVNIMFFYFLHFVFFQVQYIHHCLKDYVERLRRNFYILFYGSHLQKREQGGWHYLFWGKDSNEKKKNIYGIFLCKFPKKQSILGFSNFILEENKNIYGNIFIP